ncbi:hypothetical protein U9M48_042100 [Paspalum notatum var. saurae]|uniref:Uncharacterized protein n=1 Tax=Paspalum notatum var. saurae TaxID=547442 RepID=A0AAQ3XH93_PASNO
MVSRLLFGMYSYTSSFSSCSKQTPMSLTSLATKTSSVLSSVNPCVEPSESLFTAISWPSERIPCTR